MTLTDSFCDSSVQQNPLKGRFHFINDSSVTFVVLAFFPSGYDNTLVTNSTAGNSSRSECINVLFKHHHHMSYQTINDLDDINRNVVQ